MNWYQTAKTLPPEFQRVEIETAQGIVVAYRSGSGTWHDATNQRIETPKRWRFID